MGINMKIMKWTFFQRQASLFRFAYILILISYHYTIQKAYFFLFQTSFAISRPPKPRLSRFVYTPIIISYQETIKKPSS